MKKINGIWVPDWERYLIPELESGPIFAGKGTVQFKKFARAVQEIKRWRTAVDIGSNYGIWTRVLGTCFSKVVCFEPNKECFEAFCANTDGLKAEIELYNCALGDEDRDALLDQASEKTTVFGRISENGIRVEMERLDNFALNEIDFIKIDVEGFEHMVVKGGMETIMRNKPIMIVEQKPNNAELHGLKQFGATNLLKKMGMKEIAEISGDFIMGW